MNMTQKDSFVIFTVRVVPRASKSEIIGLHEGVLKVRVASPPVDGAANTELIKLLAKQFNVSKSDIEIASGLASRIKQIRISGVESERIALILKGKS